MKLEAIDPKLYFATDFSEVNGEISTQAPHGCILAKPSAAPEPIDLPIESTSSVSNFIIFVTKFHTGSISARMAASDVSPGYTEYPGNSTRRK